MKIANLVCSKPRGIHMKRTRRQFTPEAIQEYLTANKKGSGYNPNPYRLFRTGNNSKFT